MTKGVVKVATSKAGIAALSFAAGAGTGFAATKYGPGLLSSAKKKLSSLTSGGNDSDNSAEVQALKAQIAQMEAAQAQQPPSAPTIRVSAPAPRQQQVADDSGIDNSPPAPPRIRASAPTQQQFPDDNADNAQADSVIPASDMSDIVQVADDTTKKTKSGLKGIVPIVILVGLAGGAFLMLKK